MASLGSTPGLVIAAGVGAAASTALTPAFEVPRQEAWARIPNRVLDAGTLARLVARGGVILGQPGDKDGGGAYAEALRQGFTADKLDRLIWLAQELPGASELAALRNRFPGRVTPAMVTEALTRHGIPPEWHGPLTDLFSEILTPGELAAAIHRGLVPNPDILLGEQPSGPRKVASYPVQPIDPVAEAAGSGFDKERLAVLVGLQGLPMGVIEAAHAFYRGIIEHGDYIAAFNESNSRNEWAEAVLEYARQIPTARDFFENALRGYHDLAWAQRQAERHGMSPEDSLVIYQNQGRPMNVHAITQGLARGGKFKPEPGELTDPYMASIVEGNLKPAYYDLAFANRYTLPSVFTMRSLAQTGVWTEAKTALRLKEAGWIPDDADEAAKAWATSATGAKADPHIGKAQTQLWTATHRSYVTGTIDRAQADGALTRLVPVAATRTDVLDLWDAERDVTVKALTPSQVKSAYTNSIITLDTALAELARLGYDQESAARLLGTVSQAPTISQIMAQVEADVRAGKVDTEEALAQLRSAGMTTQNAAALVNTWQGGTPAA